MEMGNGSDETPLLSEDLGESAVVQYSDSLEINGSLQLSNHVGVDDTQNVGCCRKFLNCLQNITVEPILLLNMLGWSIQSSLTSNLLLEKVCREYHYDNVTCANLSSNHEAQVIVQREVTLINMYKELLTAIPNIFFVLFLGNWSDKYGRKIPLTLPLCGSFLGALLLMVNAYWVELPSMFILISGVPQMFTGGFITMLMAAYSYIADITKVRARTSRIAIMDLFMVAGAPIGIYCSDWIYYELSYVGIFGISAALFFLALMYSIIRIEDTRGPFSKLHLENAEFAQRPRNMCKDLFDTGNVKSVLKVCFKLRPNKARGKILGLNLSMFASLFVYGLSNISFLYVKRKFGWDYDQYVHLKLVDIVVTIIGTSIVLPVLSYRLRVHDATLGLIGCISHIVSAVIQGIAPEAWFMYLGACVSSLGSISILVNRSMLSKAVPDGEIGKIFALTASCEAAVPLMSSPLFTLVYNNTISFFPGAVYLLSALFYVVPGIVFSWLYITRHIPLVECHNHEESIPDIE